MKLHANLLAAVNLGLTYILLNGKQADTVVEELLVSNKKWGKRDRNFIAENIYNVIRYKRLYEYCAETDEYDENYIAKLVLTKLILEKADPSVDLLTAAQIDEDKVKLHAVEAAGIRKIAESIPDWLDELGEQELGSQWGTELHALNQQATLSLRVNTIRNSVAQLKTLLNAEGIEYTEVPYAPNAIVLAKRKSLKNLPAYKEGMFEIQDVSSQLVAPMLQLKQGLTVVDACAGAGGKTLHMAQIMNNNGTLIAMDVSEHKLTELQVRAKRAGVSILNTYLAGENTVTSLHEKADRLLLDVPCSGTGVLRRKPDAKWKLSPEFMDEVKAQQRELLDNYSTIVKPGGLMIYSTCSIFPSENEGQIAAFIERQQGRFKLVEDKKVSPAESGFDGFYIALLKRI